MRVLVIGGQGYIGSYLVPYLTENNILTTYYGSRELDYNKLDKSYLEVYTHIIILAGHSSVQMCLNDLQSPWKNNVRNLKNIIDKTNKDQTIIYASSASVYGNKGTKLYTEEDISVDFVNNYDLTKVTIDLLASKYMTQGRKIIGLRFGTVNGGSSVIRKDLMINSMVHSALDTGHIFVSNKHISRPILSIRDLSRAVLVILQNPIVSNIFNLASFNSTVDSISKIVSENTKVDIIDKGNTNDTYNFAIDNTKFKYMYKFVYEDNIHTVVDSVINCYKYDNPNIVIRNKPFKYD